jgi:uncharacterized protein YjbI with pentapeptide repeats
MKLTPFLFEVSAEALTKFYKQKFEDLSKTEEDLLGLRTWEEFLEYIMKVDPTKTKDYSRWLIERWLASGFELEDADKVREYLELFHTHKKKLPVKDIGRIKSSGELFQILKNAGVIGVSVSGINPGELQALVQSKDIKFMGDLPKWLVYVPITVKGSCYLGKETEWCTAKYKPDDERNMFNYYNKDGELWVFINKNPSSAEPTKIQIHFDSGQIMDQDDKDIDKDLLKQTYPEIPEFLIKTAKNLVKSNKDLNIGLFPEYWDDEIKLKILRRELHYYGENLVIDNFELNQEIWDSVDENLLDINRLSFTDCIFKQIDFQTKTPKRVYNSKFQACKIYVYRRIELKDCVVFNCEIINSDKNTNMYNNFSIFIDGSELTDTRIIECNLTGAKDVKFHQCIFINKYNMGNLQNCSFNRCSFTNAIGRYYKCGFNQCNFSQQMFKEFNFDADDVINTFEKCKLDDYTKQQIPFNEVLKENNIKPSLATLLFEMPMISSQQAETNKLALQFVEQRSDLVNFNLYILEPNGQPTIYGHMVLNQEPDCNAWQVVAVAAEKNYGPLMYDIAMSWLNSPIMSDRLTPSRTAMNVWNYMFKDEVKYTKVKLINCGPSRKPSHSEFGIKINKPVEYKRLADQHKIYVQQLKQYGDPNPDELINDAGYTLFSKKY